ncbi:alpha/beta fold hydrolase [Hoeflea prorocentri]|uniref:Alpha/beta fold hydrolase n=1 Tax=Hoeflea prorocentri TaxID=1922333 RepID=A0A9X3UEC2_9HYPH|nr:alpha/beta fold hydrolase [Hoeflea prorocentri]MCY6379176.1 alpha/beta fold hydrolase [Hoeflea prorocentri]MDA5396977.1 alpha/beta fold hydrolase [Hoeflea prorocentri]
MADIDPISLHDPLEEQFKAEFEDRLEAAIARPDTENTVRPFLFEKTISFAVIDSAGTIIWTDRKFDDWLRQDDIDIEIGAAVSKKREAAHALIKDRSQRPALLTYASADLAQRWFVLEPKLSTHVRTSDTIVVAAVSLSHMTDEIEYAARALGMSNLEARVSAALFAQGSIKRAAAQAGVTYHTARKALSGAMKSVGVSRQTSLMRRLSELATVSAPPRAAVENILIDVFDLTRRDAKLVHLLCEGYSRSEAAKVAGMSAAIAKDRFAHIFLRLDIASATDLPPLVMGAFASAMLLQETPALIETGRRARAPLRLIRSTDNRVIAVNDYGPETGQPVLIAHSSLSTRHAFQTVVDCLQQNGYRPFSIDRPGFGLTDDLEELPDRFATGTDDVVTVCDKFGFEKIHAITRGGAFHVLALARSAPERLDRVLVINPDLLQHDCSQRKGYLGMVRYAFDRYPDSIEKVARWIASTMSRKRIATIIRVGIGDAPADLESFADARNFDDYLRSIMPFSTGRLSGFIREQKGYVLQKEIEGLESAHNWTVLLGNSDPIHDIEEIRSYWTAKLPGARWHVFQDAGRYISLSHTEKVVALLNQSASQTE